MPNDAPVSDASAVLHDLTARFVARHGPEAFEAVLEALDAFLGTHPISCLPDTLAVAPIFGDLLGRSRKQCRNALDGIRDGEPVWMIVTFTPREDKPRECTDVRSVVGPCGPIRISFEDVVGGRS